MNLSHFNKYKDGVISAENLEKYGKFDDACFKYVMHGITYVRLFQIKHVTDESKKITYDSIALEDSSISRIRRNPLQSRYSLPTYFKSFLNITNKEEVESYCIFTNISFDLDDASLTDLFQEFTVIDDILDVDVRFGDKVPRKWKIIYSVLKEKELYNDFIKIAENRTSSNKTSDTFVKEFCDKFTFATGQPNCNEMSSILINELQRISTDVGTNSELFEQFYIDLVTNTTHITLSYDQLITKVRNCFDIDNEDLR